MNDTQASTRIIDAKNRRAAPKGHNNRYVKGRQQDEVPRVSTKQQSPTAVGNTHKSPMQATPLGGNTHSGSGSTAPKTQEQQHGKGKSVKARTIGKSAKGQNHRKVSQSQNQSRTHKSPTSGRPRNTICLYALRLLGIST